MSTNFIFNRGNKVFVLIKGEQNSQLGGPQKERIPREKKKKAFKNGKQIFFKKNIIKSAKGQR